MQNYCKTIGALAAASALVAGNALAGTSAPAPAPASAPESGIEYQLHGGYTSEYLFRGVTLGQDLVEVGVDVSGEWNGLGLSAGAWYGSYDTGGEIDGLGDVREVDVDELDLYAEVSKDFGFLTAAVGYIYYFNEDSITQNASKFGLDKNINDAQEVYFSVSRDFGFANASLTYFWDIEEDNEGYSELALDRSFEINQCLALNVSSAFGFLTEGFEGVHWTTKVGLDWAFRENAKLSPFVALSIGLGDDDESSWEHTENEFVAGSMLSVSF